MSSFYSRKCKKNAKLKFLIYFEFYYSGKLFLSSAVVVYIKRFRDRFIKTFRGVFSLTKLYVNRLANGDMKKPYTKYLYCLFNFYLLMKSKIEILPEKIHREISAELENLKTGLKVVKLRFDVKSH